MKETVEFIKDTFNAGIDRLKFPLFNSLVISWAIFNWKPIFIVLFSGKPIEDRIALVPSFTPWYNIYFFPPIIALLYVFLFPHVKKWVHSCLKDVNNRNRDDKYQFRIDAYEKKNKLAVEKYNYSLKKAGIENVVELTQKIDTLTSEIEKVKKELLNANRLIEKKNEENHTLTKRAERLEKSYEEVDRIIDVFSSGSQEQISIMERYIDPKLKQSSDELTRALEVAYKFIRYPRREYEMLKEKLGLPHRPIA